MSWLINRINKLKDDPEYIMEGLRLEIGELKAENERLIMKLSACSVAALSNTIESRNKQRIHKDNPYYSASYQDVCDAVDREIKHRMESDAKDKRIAELELALKKIENKGFVFKRVYKDSSFTTMCGNCQEKVAIAKSTQEKK